MLSFFRMRMMWAILCLAVNAAAPTDKTNAASNWSAIPCGELFDPLRADPKQPRFSATYEWVSQADRHLNVGSAALGQSFGLLRWDGAEASHVFQLNLCAAVFSQFDMQAPLTDLINTDFEIGLSLDYRRRSSSARIKVYHQSSHLGDEYLEHNSPQFVNLHFESAELLLSHDLHAWRVYGGGEFMLHRKPSNIGRGLAHVGVEWRPPGLLGGFIGRWGGRLISAVDVKAWQETGWAAAVSLKSGLEFSATDAGFCRVPRRSLLVEFYHGFNPYGQFYTDKVSYFGVGVELEL
jgi:hypothetical protein